MGNIDILIVSETNIDDTFPTSQFIFSGFTASFRFDLRDNGEGILVYVREDIPSKLLKMSYIYTNTECLMTEINLSKTK